MNWPFKFLPKLRMNHSENNIFNAVGVPEKNVIDCMKAYYEHLADSVDNGTLEGVHRIPESFVVDFLMNYDYSSLNDMIICIGKVYGTLSQGQQFNPDTSKRFLGSTRTQKLMAKGMANVIDDVLDLSPEKAERLKELLKLSEDADYMRSLPREDSLAIINELIEIKNHIEDER